MRNGGQEVGMVSKCTIVLLVRRSNECGRGERSESRGWGEELIDRKGVGSGGSGESGFGVVECGNGCLDGVWASLLGALCIFPISRSLVRVALHCITMLGLPHKCCV